MKRNHRLRVVLLTVLFLFGIAAVALIRTDDPALKNVEMNTETPAQTSDAQQTSEVPQDDTLTISFVGDCMFASDHGTAEPGSFNLKAQQEPPDYFLRNFIPLFTEDDFTIANCECVLTDNDLPEKVAGGARCFWFKGPARHAEIFRAGGVQFASVVNNHSHDYRQQGSDDTVAALESVGVLPGRRDEVTYTQVKNQKLGIFCDEVARSEDLYDLRKKVEEMRRSDCDLIILYLHSGIEYQTMPEKWLVRAFRELIDDGVDIIVSSHPHVIQPMEVYHGKPILYSMGNFCFGGNYHPPIDTIVYQAVYTLHGGEIADRQDVLIPCATFSGEQNNFQPYIVTDEAKKQEILQFMHTPIDS